MPAIKGKLLLVKVGANTVTEARTTSLKINNELVDVTNKGSSGWRESLDGAGIASMSMSLEGTWTNSTAGQALRDYAISGDQETVVITDGNGDEYEGLFVVTSFEMSGDYNTAQMWTATLESSGVITFTPGP